MKVVIIGAGPAGMMAGIKAAENGNEVLILEKNTIPGKKLNITGKGRCNISFTGDMEYFLSNVVTNPKFMMSSINNLDNYSLVDYVNSLSVKTKEERGNRVFLASDDASELTEALKRELKRLNVKLQYSSVVKRINIDNNKVTGVTLEDGTKILADKVIIAVGGKSYPLTGSTGDGYTLAKEVGHTVTDIRPALVPFRLKETDICKSLKGVSLRNVTLKVNIDGKEVDNRFGEMVFTDKGISGPIVLSSSSKINKIQDLDTLAKENKVKVYIDLKPALDKEELYKRITRDFEKYSNKEFKNSLSDLTISSLVPVIVKASKIEEAKKVNSITKEEKERLVNTFKNLEFTFSSLESVAVGIVTSGGVNVKEVSPKTMESKIIEGLYFAGEVLDVDAYTGGFNLQIAFSTGYTAGINI